MTEEDKKLLLKTLCETAPHGVKGLALGRETDTIKTICLSEYPFIVTNGGLTCHVGEQFKPYLRPMDSMTEDERDEYNEQHHLAGSGKWLVWEDEVDARTDFLNAHLLDHRGLIEKGLANKAPKGMYNF